MRTARGSGLRLARDELEQVVTVAVDPGRPEALHRRELVQAARPSRREVTERRVVEDDVRRHAVRLRALTTPGAQPFEQGVVDGPRGPGRAERRQRATRERAEHLEA